MVEEEVIMEIKPKYKIGYNIVTHFIDFAIIIAIIVILGVKVNIWASLIIVLLVFILGWTIYFIANNAKYKKFYYKFYKNKLVYHNSMWRKNPREVSYEDLKEIRYNQSFIQNKFNTGEIYIHMGIYRMITLSYIENVEKQYDDLCKLFNIN